MYHHCAALDDLPLLPSVLALTANNLTMLPALELRCTYLWQLVVHTCGSWLGYYGDSDAECCLHLCLPVVFYSLLIIVHLCCFSSLPCVDICSPLSTSCFQLGVGISSESESFVFALLVTDC